MLGHWGKKTNVWGIHEKKKQTQKQKNPVIGNVSDEGMGKNMGKKKKLTEAQNQYLM